jgi:hypothetical protein
MSKCNHDHRRPFGPIKTTLGFPELQGLARLLGMPMSCGMCGHKFALGATTSDHECKPPMFQIEVVEVKPLPPLAAGSLFFLDYTYGKDAGGDDPTPTLASLADGKPTP